LALFDALFAPAARHHNPRDSRREARRNTLSREHLRPHIDFLTKLAQASGVETLRRIRVRVGRPPRRIARRVLGVPVDVVLLEDLIQSRVERMHSATRQFVRHHPRRAQAGRRSSAGRRAL